MIGQRHETLLTLCLAKERDYNGGDLPRVYRLAVLPSRRMQLLGRGPVTPAATAPAPRETQLVGTRDEDFPDEEDGEDGEDEPTAIQPVMRPYHGTRGFVAVGREVFSSPMFTNRRTDDVFHLIDLYGMAQIADGELNAPGTQQRVHLVRGQVMTSVRMLSKRWGITEKVVRGFLERVAKDELIRQDVVMSDGARRPSNTSTGTLKGTSNKAVCTVITCLHYRPYDTSRSSARQPEGT